MALLSNTNPRGFITLFLLGVLACMLFVSLPFLFRTVPQAQSELMHVKPGKSWNQASAAGYLEQQMKDFHLYALQRGIPYPQDTSTTNLVQHVAANADVSSEVLLEFLEDYRLSLYWDERIQVTTH